MSVHFTGASTQYITNSAAPALAYPFTVGLWCQLAAVNTVQRVLWAYSDTGSTDNYYEVSMTTTEIVRMNITAGGSNQGTNIATLTVGEWTFVCVRWISAAERRGTVLQVGNATIHTAVSTTTSIAPAGLDTMTLGIRTTSGGSTLPWDGRLAEVWVTSADVGSVGQNLTTAQTWALAFRGPFAIPHVKANLYMYRSMRDNVESRMDKPSNSYYRGGQQSWLQTNSPQLAPHPPLPYWYVRPGQTRRQLMI